MKKLSLAILGVLLAGTPALAQKAKYTRNSEVKVDVKLSDRTKPSPMKPIDPKTSQPTLSADDVLSIEGLVGNIRGEQETILAELIQNTPDAEVEEKSDYYFRLGELYAKQQRYWRLKAVEAQIQSDSAKAGPQKSKLKSDSAAAATKAKDYLIKAVKTYKGLTDNDNFRNYPKMDMALFYYGYTLQGGKYMKEARAVYDKLLKNYPNSKYVPQAHLVFAEYFFDANQLADAEARYKMVLKFPLSSAYWFAMYKMGWINLNLQRYQEALETFFQITQATKNDAKQALLNSAAKRGFVRAYAEIGKLDKANAAFSRVDKDGAEAMTESLADLFLEQGKFEKTIAVYQELLKQSPTSPSACLWMSSSARASAYLNSGKLVDVCAREVQTLKEWARANGGALTN